MGRFLPPSDRANLYGPYYSHHWACLHRRHPGRVSVRLPRVATTACVYWGEFGKVKVSGGRSSTGSPRPATPTCSRPRACRSTSGTPESGYYLNGTYYGGKNLLAVGGAIQAQDGNTAATRRFPAREEARRRRRVHDRERVRQLRRARRLRRAATPRATARYVLGSYLFPQAGRHRQGRDSRQVRQGATSAKGITLDRRTTTRRRPRSTSTTSSRSSTPA